MNPTSKDVVRVYITLMALSTAALSLTYGINTLFLLDAGLSNLEAFAANAFFTLGQVVFEVPTGVVADVWGRRASYVLGCIALFAATVFYYLSWVNHAPFWQWAIVSVALGLGFTFFSGAVEAWLVDALTHTKYEAQLEDVFAKGQMVNGGAMLSSTIVGGVIAQSVSLGAPFVGRIALLGVTLVIAWRLMFDIGFVPDKSVTPTKRVREVFTDSVRFGLNNPPVRWLMIGGSFTTGVIFYGFYAMQPYLLQLFGNPNAYGIAGLAAAIVAAAQIAGSFLVPYARKLFKNRTSLLAVGVAVSATSLALIGLSQNFWIVIALLIVWAMVFAATMPVRQAYINGLIPSKQRATVLSFDSLVGSTGGVVAQPLLGRAADMYGYANSYIITGCVQLMTLPFTLLAKKEKAKSDSIKL